MTEEEWLSSNDVSEMLVHLLFELNGRSLCDRKLRLFACACCRLIWSELPHDFCRRGVEVAECYADELATIADLRRAHKELSEHPIDDRPFQFLLYDEWDRMPAHRALMVAYTAMGNLHGPATIPGLSLGAVYAAQQTPPALFRYESLLSSPRGIRQLEATHVARDIFGNPFRPVTFVRSWLTSTVVALANGIYSEKAFDRMPILADALQDAGCDNEDILNHCRQPGEHVRGCWVVDLLTGQE